MKKNFWQHFYKWKVESGKRCPQPVCEARALQVGNALGAKVSYALCADVFRKMQAFSLVELMISLIVISVVTAAFAPIVTKKLKTSDMSIGSGAVDYIYDSDICSASVANCSVCVSNECVKCNSGYYLDDSDGKCKPCADSNCSSCSNATKCTVCKNGYYLNGNNCSACADGCTSCTGGGASQCSACQSGYYKDGSSCKACSAGCLSCTGASSCTKCSGGYNLKSGKCEAIICKENCITCDLTGGCTKCADGYYLDSSTKECKACSTGCSVCTSSSSCITCKEKYIKIGSSCTACPKGCIECSSATSCTTCIENCEICLSNTGCVKCKQGYFWNGVTCSKCKFSDSIVIINGLSVYRYNLGDECGPALPSGAHVCAINMPKCSNPLTEPACTKPVGYNFTADSYCTHEVSTKSYYSGCTRTVCNPLMSREALKTSVGKSGAVLEAEGWREITRADAQVLAGYSYGIAVQKCSFSTISNYIACPHGGNPWLQSLGAGGNDWIAPNHIWLSISDGGDYDLTYWHDSMQPLGGTYAWSYQALPSISVRYVK